MFCALRTALHDTREAEPEAHDRSNLVPRALFPAQSAWHQRESPWGRRARGIGAEQDGARSSERTTEVRGVDVGTWWGRDFGYHNGQKKKDVCVAEQGRSLSLRLGLGLGLRLKLRLKLRLMSGSTSFPGRQDGEEAFDLTKTKEKSSKEGHPIFIGGTTQLPAYLAAFPIHICCTAKLALPHNFPQTNCVSYHTEKVTSLRGP